MIVDGNGWSAVALSQTGNFADRDIALAHSLKALLQARSQGVGAAQMTSHVGADSHSYFRRRRQVKMRKEVRHAVNVVQRDLGLLRESLQLLAWQVTVLILNGSEIVENQRLAPSFNSLALHSGVRFYYR